MTKKFALTLSLPFLFLHLMYGSFGNNWIRILSNVGSIVSIRVNPQNQDIVYASGSMGVRKTTNSGVNWFQVNSGLPPGSSVGPMDLCRDNPNVLYVGVSGSVNGVYITTNEGNTWVGRYSGITQTPIVIQAIAIDPTNPNIAYVAVWDGASTVTTPVFKTTNQGVSWFATSSGIRPTWPILCIGVDWNTPTTLYCGSSFVNPNGPTYIYKSTDGAATWFNSSNGLDTSVDNINPVRALSVSTANPQIILAGLFCNSGRPESGSAWLSTNGGALWTQIRAGLPIAPGERIRSCLIRSGTTSEFYLGYDGFPDTSGVYKSSNQGQTWVNYNGGELRNDMIVRSLAARDTVIYAGVSGPLSSNAGVYKNQEPPVGISGSNENSPKVFALFQNFPNPLNPVTYIQYDIPKESYIVLRVYDIAGKELRTLVDETKQAGSYEVLFDASSLSSGIYFYRLSAVPDGRQAGEFAESKKMTVVK